MIDAKDDKYSYTAETKEFLDEFGESEKASDLRAVVSSVYRYKSIDDEQIKRMIRLAGHLDESTVHKFLQVYKSTMHDLEELFFADKRMKKMIEG